jgi:hypothetical protein
VPRPRETTPADTAAPTQAKHPGNLSSGSDAAAAAGSAMHSPPQPATYLAAARAGQDQGFASMEQLAQLEQLWPSGTLQQQGPAQQAIPQRQAHPPAGAQEPPPPPAADIKHSGAFADQVVDRLKQERQGLQAELREREGQIQQLQQELLQVKSRMAQRAQQLAEELRAAEARAQEQHAELEERRKEERVMNKRWAAGVKRWSLLAARLACGGSDRLSRLAAAGWHPTTCRLPQVVQHGTPHHACGAGTTPR